MRELQGYYALRLQENLHSPDKIIEIGHLGEHVITDKQIRAQPFLRQPARGLFAKEFDDRGDALSDGNLGDVCCRLDAGGRNPRSHEMLEEVAVVAGQFDNMLPRPKAIPLDHFLCIDPSVLNPTVRIRREVGIITENMRGANIGIKLNQETAAAYVNMQRVKRLHFVQLSPIQIAFTEGRHPQIHKRVSQRRTTTSALSLL